jgi:ABC-type transport system involved in cytochrome bd biosynthesis fused ATPase/permease subunit
MAHGLALLALACGVLLAGLSVWFLGAVAIAGLSAAALTFNFHVPGALVRLFAIGRTAAKYGERLVGHDAALRDQMRRRGDLFVRMASAPAVRSAGWQLGDQDRLADYLDDVEDLDNGRLRVDMPALALGMGLAVCLVATLVLVPLAALPIGAMGLAAAMLGRHMARLAAYRMEEIRRLRRAGGRIVGEAAASVVPLQAEGAWRGRIESGLARLGQAEEERRVLRIEASRLDAVLAAFGPLSALAVMAAASFGGAKGEGLLVPAFLAFSWFALAEAGQGASRILLAAALRRIASREIGRLLGPERERAPSGPVPSTPPALRLSRFQRRAPGGRPIGVPLHAVFARGRPTALVGPSGCGKTSLLKQIAGWLDDEAGLSLPARERRAGSVFCPHDAAILADTLRANLFAPHASNADLDAALAAMELTERVAAAGGLDAWIAQDALSLGEAQRLNLARAWLSDRPIVLLDEPTEHLDEAQGRRILGRLLERLGDRIVVLSTHRDIGGEAEILRL